MTVEVEIRLMQLQALELQESTAATRSYKEVGRDPPQSFRGSMAPLPLDRRLLASRNLRESTSVA